MYSTLRPHAQLAPSPAGPRGGQGGEPSAPPRPQGVLISCTDADCMEGRLERFDASRVLIVRTPANAVAVGGDAGSGVLSAIESAVAGGHLNGILVCGHSRCRALRAALRSRRGDGPGPETPAEDGQGRGLGRLIRGVRESAALLAEAKANVLVQLEALLSSPVIREAAAHGVLALQGWVHLDESGLFLGYDPEGHRFEPIAEGVAELIL